MHSHLVSWVIGLGMAAAVTGCASTQPSGGPTMVDRSNYHRLIRPPAIIATVDGAIRTLCVRTNP